MFCCRVITVYKLFKDPITQKEDRMIIKVLGDGAKLNIPFDPENTDYQEYLEWVAAGNTPDPDD